MLIWPAKDPDEILDYVIDWYAGNGDKLGPLQIDQDTIINDASGSEWIVPDGITMVTDTRTDTTTTIWLSGGTIGQRYELVNRIKTVGGRTHDQTVKLTVKSK